MLQKYRRLLVYGTIIGITSAGIIGGFFRSYFWNPLDWSLQAFCVVVLLWFTLTYRRHPCVGGAGMMALLGGGVGFIGGGEGVAFAFITGIIACIFAGIALGDITFSGKK